MKLAERLMRLETRARRAADRNERRYHDLVAEVSTRLDLIEAQLAEHVADTKRHTGK